MTSYEEILNRRSIRKYKDTPVEQEIIDKILVAGTYAATAKGDQSPIIVSIENKEDRDAIEVINMTSVGRPAGTPFYGAPYVAVVFAEKGNPNSVQDASLVMGNMMQAAYSLGVGSCWINRAKESFETEEGKALMKKWGLDPEAWVGVANLILGYADQEPVAKERKPDYIIRAK
jgi:nitroreductase